MANQEEKWITVKGRHILLGSGESVDDAIKRTFAKTKSDANKQVDKRESDIEKAQAETKRLNAEQKYQDSLKQGTKVTNKNGVMTFKGKSYKLGDYDNICTIEPSRKYPNGDSMYRALDKNGNLSAERAEIHRQVLEDYFTKIRDANGNEVPITYTPYAPDEEKRALFTGGGGAAGKGQLSAMSESGSGFNKFYGSDKRHLVIDADRLKFMLWQHDVKNGMYDEEFKAYKVDHPNAKMEDLFNAGYYHNESSALADQVWSMSIDNNYPVMYDGTATKPKSVERRLKSCRAKGYSCHSNYIFADEPTVRENSIYRYCKGDDYGMNRLVPVEILMGAHQKAQKAVPEIASMYDSFTLWDNTGRKLTKVASQTGGKKLTISDRDRWNTFQSKQHADSFDYLSQEKQDEYNALAEKRKAQWDKEHPKKK